MTVGCKVGFKKMKLLLKIICGLCLFAGSLQADNLKNELDTLDKLIKSTQKSLDEQKQLRALIQDYQTFQENYINNPDDNDLLFRTAKAGLLVLNKIQECHLQHNFNPTFISELNLFAQVANKKGIPKP